MKKLALPFLLAFVLIFECFSQGYLRGKVTDEYGEPMIGATVAVASNNAEGTMTDFDGNFSLRITSAPPQVITISFIGYSPVQDTLNIANGKVEVYNYTLSSEVIVGDEVVITAKSDKSTDLYLDRLRKTSAISLDYISSETIKQVGDSKVDDAIKRVAGVSTVDGYISVRGLADRYNKTTVNGLLIPTLDPFTNNLKLDIFPTGLINNIMITKTSSPDLPGDWAGSHVSIETKDYPEKFTLNVSTSVGYNNQSTFNTIPTSNKSKTDWLGYDNGFRDIDHYSRSEFPYYNSGSVYELWTALGLEDFMQEEGITEENLQKGFDNVYYKLGLIELGLLAPAQINNQEAYYNAVDEYVNNPDYKDAAFLKLNEDLIRFGQETLDTGWIINRKKAPISFSQEVSVGNQVNLFGKPLGFLVGFRYDQSVKYEPNENRNDYSPNAGDLTRISDFSREESEIHNGLSGLANLAYKFNPNHSVSLFFMPNLKGINKTRLDSGSTVLSEPEGYNYEIIHEQFYEERKQLIYQYHSKHYFPNPGILMNIDASYTDGNRNNPDYRILNYGEFTANPDLYLLRQNSNPQRMFRSLDEDLLHVKGDLEIPFFEKPGKKRNIKIGGSYIEKEKTWEDYIYILSGNLQETDLLVSKDTLSNVFSTNTYSWIRNAELANYYILSTDDKNFAKGISKVSAGYAMLDFSVNSRLRLAGGLRIEYTDMKADLTKFFGKGIPNSSKLRSTTVSGGQSNAAKASNIAEYNFLPSVNFIYKIIENEKMTLNSRLNYFHSIARPSIREIAAYYNFDIDFGTFVWGNPDLNTAHVHNYDLRFESYFRNNDNLSFSLFYKLFIDHIELIDNGLYTWANSLPSKAFGMEVEGKKDLFLGFELRGNLTLVSSSTHSQKIGLDGQPTGHYILDKMYGQAPYTANGILIYHSEKLGISSSASYNIQGARIVVKKVNGAPNIYEMPRHLFDFKISKSFGKHFSTSFKIRNLLGSPETMAYYFENRFDNFYESTNYGTSYSFTISYKI